MRRRRSIVGLAILSLSIALVMPPAASAGWGLPSDSSGCAPWVTFGVAVMGLLGLVFQTAMAFRRSRDAASRASGFLAPAQGIGLATFARLGRSMIGLVAKLGLILAEISLLILLLLLFDIAML